MSRCVYFIAFFLIAMNSSGVQGDSIPKGASLKLVLDHKKAESGFPQVFSSLAWAPDARSLYSSSFDRQIRVWDAVNGKQLRGWQGHTSWATELVLSPDGRTLITGGTDNKSPLWESATGKKITELDRAGHRFFAFTPDSKGILTGINQVELYSATTGEYVRPLETKVGRMFHYLRISSDGESLAIVSTANFVDLLDAATGKLRHRLKQQDAIHASFSPDGRLLAVGGEDKPIRLWDVATGKELRKMEPGAQISRLDFSARGAWLAASCYDKTVRIWDVNSGKELASLKGHTERVESLAFSPDGRTLASGGWDGCIILWDLRKALPGQTEPVPVFNEKELQHFWNDLANEDAGLAYRSVWKLAAAGDAAVKLAARHLQPINRIDAKHIARLINELDANEFAVRQRASQELAKLEELVEGSLREASKNSASAEVRRRADQLLQRLKESKAPNRLRAERALVLLEHIGSPEAKKLLQRLASGTDQASLTKDAKRALERLNR